MFYFPIIFSLILFSDDHFFNKFNNELHTDDRQREKESTAGGKGGRGGWVEEMGRGRGGSEAGGSGGEMGGGDG